MLGQWRGARTERRAGALAHDACRKRERRGTGWVPQWKAGVCKSKRGRLLWLSTLGPSGQRAKLSGLQPSRLSFAQAQRYFPGGPCADDFGDFRREVTSQGLSTHARAGGRGFQGGEQRQVGEGRPWKGLGIAGTCSHFCGPAVDGSGDLSGEEGRATLSSRGARPARPSLLTVVLLLTSSS